MYHNFITYSRFFTYNPDHGMQPEGYGLERGL